MKQKHAPSEKELKAKIRQVALKFDCDKAITIVKERYPNLRGAAVYVRASEIMFDALRKIDWIASAEVDYRAAKKKLERRLSSNPIVRQHRKLQRELAAMQADRANSYKELSAAGRDRGPKRGSKIRAWAFNVQLAEGSIKRLEQALDDMRWDPKLDASRRAARKAKNQLKTEHPIGFVLVLWMDTVVADARAAYRRKSTWSVSTH